MKNKSISLLALLLAAVALWHGRNPVAQTAATIPSPAADTRHAWRPPENTNPLTLLDPAQTEVRVQPANASEVRADLTDWTEAIVARIDPRILEQPDAEDWIRNRLWLELDLLNSPLVERLGLTDGEKERWRQVIADRFVDTVNSTADIIDEPWSDLQVELDRALAVRAPEYDERLRAILGELRLAEYSAGRDKFARFNDLKFLAGSEALDDARAEELLGFWVTQQHVVADAAEQFLASVAASDGETARRRAVQQIINQRVYRQAESSLSAGQLAGLAELQARELERAVGQP
jgi:hypothetical protein